MTDHPIKNTSNTIVLFLKKKINMQNHLVSLLKSEIKIVEQIVQSQDHIKQLRRSFNNVLRAGQYLGSYHGSEIVDNYLWKAVEHISDSLNKIHKEGKIVLSLQHTCEYNSINTSPTKLNYVVLFQQLSKSTMQTSGTRTILRTMSFDSVQDMQTNFMQKIDRIKPMDILSVSLDQNPSTGAIRAIVLCR